MTVYRYDLCETAVNNTIYYRIIIENSVLNRILFSIVKQSDRKVVTKLLLVFGWMSVRPRIYTSPVLGKQIMHDVTRINKKKKIINK